jgi:hypothetical protein
MLKALALKELRELAPIAGLALCVYALIVARATGVELFFFQWWPRAYNEVPFVTDSFADMIVLVSACLAVALAVRQTIGESRRSTWHWLLHRPLTRKQIIFVKLAAGVAVYLVCGALPILWYAGWAASPRTHPSPFYWSMTAETCEAWALSLSLYFAAFLCGLWPAHTVGPRWAPVVGMGAAIMFGYMTLSPISTAAIWVLPLVLIGLTVSSIFYISRIRDFS